MDVEKYSRNWDNDHRYYADIDKGKWCHTFEQAKYLVIKYLISTKRVKAGSTADGYIHYRLPNKDGMIRERWGYGHIWVTPELDCYVITAFRNTRNGEKRRHIVLKDMI